MASKRASVPAATLRAGRETDRDVAVRVLKSYGRFDQLTPAQEGLPLPIPEPIPCAQTRSGYFGVLPGSSDPNKWVAMFNGRRVGGDYETAWGAGCAVHAMLRQQALGGYSGGVTPGAPPAG